MRRPPYITSVIVIAVVIAGKWILNSVRGSIEGPLAAQALENSASSSAINNMVASGLLDKLFIGVCLLILVIVWIRFFANRRSALGTNPPDGTQ